MLPPEAPPEIAETSGYIPRGLPGICEVQTMQQENTG